MVDLLVIAAHPDDAEISLGGTLLVAKDQGQSTAVLDLTRAELSSRGDPETRQQETEEATRRLGLDARENLDLPDGAVTDGPEARQRLAAVIRRLRPRVVLAPWTEDLHADHAGAGRLVAATWYLLGVRKFAPETPPHRPQLLGFYMLHTPFEPHAIVDVSDAWERKLEAIMAFRSQFHDDGVSGANTKIAQPHFMAAVEGRARDYGLQAGCEFGEPLRWHQPPAIVDPVTLTHAEGGPR